MENPARNEHHATQPEKKKQSRKQKLSPENSYKGERKATSEPSFYPDLADTNT
jgi:hypothetical protein